VRLLSSTIFGLVLLAGLSGCATVRQESRAAPPCCGCDGRTVVFCADGAGNTQGLSTALREAFAAQHLPVCVETVEWSYGPYRFLADQIDYRHARNAGCELAARITALRQTAPETRIYLVGHSAGSAVILAAAEALPPGSIEEIVLLAPAVSAQYDLRPALRAAHQGIDVFCSERDRAILGIGVAVVGTTDRRWTAAAGRVGFQPPQGASAEEVALYAKLREHPWVPCLAWTGNYGGHFDTYQQPMYLRAYVLPLLAAGGH
jgi:pimeloyl-ACP methyl ester carboxylesterase